MNLFLKVLAFVGTATVASAVTAAEDRYECVVTQVMNAGNDPEFIAQGLRKRFLITVDSEKVFVTTISSDAKTRQDVFIILNRNSIFNSLYAVSISDISNESFALYERSSDGVHLGTLVAQAALTANVWKLNCERI